jgi:hypothetical protein
MLTPKRSEDTTYRGVKSPDGSRVLREDSSGAVVLVNEADSEWGIDSEKSERLAFLLLADAFSDDEASAFSTDFKFDVVADLEDEWVLTVGDIADWLRGYADD